MTQGQSESVQEKLPIILVVDDNSTNRLILDEMLTRWHMDPTLSESGKQALMAMKDAVQHDKQYPLVIIDLFMPDIDGAAVVERISNIDNRIPMLLVSGFTQETDKIEVLQTRRSNIGFLAKPYRSEGLVASVKALLDPDPRQSAVSH